VTEIETRTVTFDGIETRTDDDGFRHLVGIVVPWDGEYRMPNGLTESFERGAFTKTLQERGDRIPLYQQHESRSTLPVGNSVNWENTADGLVADFRMARTERAAEVLSLADDGMVTGLSVGFIPVRSRTETRGTGQHVVRVEARMDHVGFVAQPAYDGARVLAVRHFDADDPEIAPRLARWRGAFA
jgi:HK97 family phage prohead protease